MPIDETNSKFIIPEKNYNLWRYMDFPSFLSLITSSTLTFVRADLFEDKFEGTLPKTTALSIDENMDNLLQMDNLQSEPFSLSKVVSDVMNKKIFMNCWCKEDSELIHMWKIYSKENGIAIATNYETLKTSLDSLEKIYPTEIRYVNFKNINILKPNTFTPYTLKQEAYKSENELRLLIFDNKNTDKEVISCKVTFN